MARIQKSTTMGTRTRASTRMVLLRSKEEPRGISMRGEEEREEKRSVQVRDM